ncbi:MAG TPA: LemA family protein [Candidatus Thermoplasmatota archaeon]|nr:LemA family protein [Candidatus Thermoplasmatota archaeon]
MSALVYLGVAALALLVLSVVVLYNKLVTVRNRIDESWSNVDTELKRRHDLVPNLVAAVQGYAAHERALLADLARLRAEALASRDATPARMAAEREMVGALGRLVAVAEAYPQLKASDSFLQLQRALVDTEDRIQAARRFFNANVRDHNNRVETLPSSLVAKAFGFRTRGYFELPSLAERVAPMV